MIWCHPIWEEGVQNSFFCIVLQNELVLCRLKLRSFKFAVICDYQKVISYLDGRGCQATFRRRRVSVCGGRRLMISRGNCETQCGSSHPKRVRFWAHRNTKFRVLRKRVRLGKFSRKNKFLYIHVLKIAVVFSIVHLKVGRIKSNVKVVSHHLASRTSCRFAMKRHHRNSSTSYRCRRCNIIKKIRARRNCRITSRKRRVSFMKRASKEGSCAFLPDVLTVLLERLYMTRFHPKWGDRDVSPSKDNFLRSTRASLLRGYYPRLV